MDDAELVVAELVVDFIRYGRWDSLTLTLTTAPGRAYLAALDDSQPDCQDLVNVEPWSGGDHQPDDTAKAEDHGRSLLLIGVLADRWGHACSSDGPHTLYAELTW